MNNVDPEFSGRLDLVNKSDLSVRLSNILPTDDGSYFITGVVIINRHAISLGDGDIASVIRVKHFSQIFGKNEISPFNYMKLYTAVSQTSTLFSLVADFEICNLIV